MLREIAERNHPDQAGRTKVSPAERDTYIALYQNRIRWSTCPSFFRWFPFYPHQKKRLLKAEERLDISTIALCRWWALARLLRPNKKVSKYSTVQYSAVFVILQVKQGK